MDSETSNLITGLKPAQITLLKPVASGILVKKNDSVTIDYSNTKDGYVMVKFTVATTLRLKVQVKGPTTTYTYNLNPEEWTVFPLSDGNGEYAIKVFKNVVDNKYATVLSLKCNIALDDEFAPFIRPNQYVNYENATNTMNKAASLLNDEMTMLEKVAVIYDFVIKNISYDYNKAATVQSGYLPDLDVVLKEKKGICFDYAALMTGMLRSQNIPCKLVVGYAGTEYHAWISVWSPETGWIDGAIFFNGTNWQRMDPTFAAGGYKDFDKIDYITKYIY
ncbi:MAG: transglutaminase domain-containing protein [Clostridia bacterium]|nr:transglutaminase domain-containing protein [Clostridia bacterium]